MNKTLKDLRLESGLTLVGLGKKIGSSAGSVGAWELGEYGPHPSRYPRLAKALQVSAETIRIAVECAKAERAARDSSLASAK